MPNLPRREQHRCPAAPCPRMVPNSRLACLEHWLILPLDVQKHVWDTARLPILHPDRRAALAAARQAWADA